MSIKPVTYQGANNFKSNLYALEIRSRFIDQDAADGYYEGYGDDLNAIVSANVITVGSGALLVQGRLNEIETGGEAVEVTIQNGYYGYVIARIETYHTADTENCTLIARTGTSLSAITLTKEDTYQKSAEGNNMVYELPIYSFYMANGAITNLEKIIKPIEENTKTREIANAALAKIDEALAQINILIDQSYAKTAGYATSSGSAANADYATSSGSAANADYATEAKSVAISTFSVSPGNDGKATLPSSMKYGQILIVSFLYSGERQTLVTMYNGGTNMSASSKHGLYCQLFGDYFYVYNGSGTAQVITMMCRII